jgi:hypothetical protein
MSGLDLEYRGLGDEAEALEEETVRLEDEYLLLKETAGLVLEGDGNVSLPPVLVLFETETEPFLLKGSV